MKYIRTKDGIYEAIEMDKNWGFLSNSPQTYGEVYIRTNNVIKQADTIEELCDEFIIYNSHKKKWLHFIDLNSLLGYCDENGLDKTEIRGCIWTNKGLIYVAKMNKEGELELL